MNVYKVTVTADIKEIPKWNFVVGAESPEEASEFAIEDMKSKESFKGVNLSVLPGDCRPFNDDDYKKLYESQEKLLKLIEETAEKGYLSEEEKEYAFKMFQELFDNDIALLDEALTKKEMSNG